MNVAFVHDWLVTYRGGEKVLEALLSLYPQAPVYTLFYDRSTMPTSIRQRDIRVPALTNALRRGRKALLPLLPRFIERLNLRGYDLIISTSSCVAKGVIPPPQCRHICYLHSPMRYIWDQQDEYLAGLSNVPMAARIIRSLTPSLRRWDVSSAARVDRFVVNSSFVGERVRNYYNRDAAVIHPPVELERFTPGQELAARPGYFLAAGALVSYKRFDLAIEACERAGKRLIVAGSGPMEAALRRLAGPMTSFEIAPDDRRFTDLMRSADGLLFPGVEDFGITAIEAMSCGTPVIAYKKGGALDFVKEGITGRFFDVAEGEALAAVLATYDRTAFDVAALNKFASGFSREQFLNSMMKQIEALMVPVQGPPLKPQERNAAQERHNGAHW